jgi:hypothetical protein
MAEFDALLDASVMIPAVLNDTLLLAAEADLYQARWSDEILEEVRRNLVGAGLTDADRAARRVAAMRRSFPQASVSGYQEIIQHMTNHPKRSPCARGSGRCQGLIHRHRQSAGLPRASAVTLSDQGVVTGRLLAPP